MKLKSFGCSFIYGSDLSDCVGPGPALPDASELTWPALIAQKYGLTYECYAWPGIGNFKILCDLINQASLKDPAVFVINWTWIDRFDFVNDHEHWETARPAQKNCHRSDIYYRNFHSHFKDMINSVYYVYTAISFLKEQGWPFLMTYTDYNMMESIDQNWHDPKYLSTMQKKIKRSLTDFDGENFLDWSRKQGFAISDAWHPLDDAHAAAAKFMAPTIDAILHRA